MHHAPCNMFVSNLGFIAGTAEAWKGWEMPTVPPFGKDSLMRHYVIVACSWFDTDSDMMLISTLWFWGFWCSLAPHFSGKLCHAPPISQGIHIVVHQTRSEESLKSWRNVKELLDSLSVYIHSPSLTWNLKMMVSKRNLLFKGAIFRFHLKLWEVCLYELHMTLRSSYASHIMFAVTSPQFSGCD